ncbi:MAG TPA: response regulator transcription factor [Pyrinomonadaceae bacterium]|nr:response regulator transcription factor [Pyrinomonadaceae bacterium]
MSKLRVFLADDHAIMRESLRLIVDSQADMECVGEAGDGREAVEQVCRLLPDVAVLDISMPQMSGLQAAGRIKQCCPQVKVVTLTRHADGGFFQQLLGAGVSGYVLKQSASDVLLAAVRAAASGGVYLDPAVTGKITGGFARSRAKPNAASPAELSAREQEVLRLIALGHSNKEIAAQTGVGVKTVEAHKANAMQKLGMRGRTDIVSYAILRGWLRNE